MPKPSLKFLRCILIGCVLLAMLAVPATAKACSCVMLGSPSNEFSRENAVFAGQVTAIVDKQNVALSVIDQIRYWFGLPPSYSFLPSNYGYRVTFTVQDSWKGVATTPIQINTGYGGGDCGYSFTVGTNYLVYASGPSQELKAYTCSRTTEISQAAADLNYLNTLPTLPLTPAPAGVNWWLSAVVLVVVLLGAALVAVLWVRRKRRIVQR